MMEREREDLNSKGAVIAQKAIQKMYLLSMLFRLKAHKQALLLAYSHSFIINTDRKPDHFQWAL